MLKFLNLCLNLLVNCRRELFWCCGILLWMVPWPNDDKESWVSKDGCSIVGWIGLDSPKPHWAILRANLHIRHESHNTNIHTYTSILLVECPLLAWALPPFIVLFEDSSISTIHSLCALGTRTNVIFETLVLVLSPFFSYFIILGAES